MLTAVDAQDVDAFHDPDPDASAGAVTRYARRGHKQVSGWLEEPVCPLLLGLAAAQRLAGVTGNVAEIGVHHGRLFILLHLLRRPAERSLAVDVFEAQHLNVDHSGAGDRAAFEANLRRFTGGSRGVTVLPADSSTIDGPLVRALLGGPVRLFSVDGGHTPELTCHDLWTAEHSLTEGGIVILDDCFNPAWPGVAEGAGRYLAHPDRRLQPFAVAFNKVFFTTADHADRYGCAANQVARRRVWAATPSTMYGDPVTILSKPGHLDRIRLLVRILLGRHLPLARSLAAPFRGKR